MVLGYRQVMVMAQPFMEVSNEEKKQIRTNTSVMVCISSRVKQITKHNGVAMVLNITKYIYEIKIALVWLECEKTNVTYKQL